MEMHREHMHQHGDDSVKAGIADRLLETMRVKDTDLVVDIGSGNGYYSFRFAERCRKVVSVDRAGDLFAGEYYAKANIDTVAADACEWVRSYDWADVDHVFFSNSFHDMSCQSSILSTFSAKLKEGALINLIEFHPDTPFGPPKSIRFSKEELKALLESYGFEEKAWFDLGTHYFVSFGKASR